MMLASDLAQSWSFDERMKWWYGDDDLVNWVNAQGRICLITNKAKCHHAHSQTVDKDPPENFAQTVNNDKEIFEKKWSK